MSFNVTLVEMLPQHQGAGFQTVFGLSMAAFGVALIASVMFVVIGRKNKVSQDFDTMSKVSFYLLHFAGASWP